MGNTGANLDGAPTQFTEKELERLHHQFSKLDKDHSGHLEAEEWLNIPTLGNNPLVRRLISVLDKDKNGKISFSEFVGGLSTLSMGTNEEDKMRFAFSIYDIDDDGYISNGDLYSTLKIMIGNNLTDIQLQQLVDRTFQKGDIDGDGLLSFEEFRAMINQLNIAAKFTIKYN